jgi:hypothetical protein
MTRIRCNTVAASVHDYGVFSSEHKEATLRFEGRQDTQKRKAANAGWALGAA